MPRVFAYCRVSTAEQTTQNQRMEIKAAGFAIESRRLIEENISGSVAAKQRSGFMKLIDRMESGDVLVVTKLDRLGRNAMDVRSTVEQLANSGIRVHCLALGGVDLTSPAGKMTMQVIAAVAEYAEPAVMRSDAIEIDVWSALWPLGAPHNIQGQGRQRMRDCGEVRQQGLGCLA